MSPPTEESRTLSDNLRTLDNLTNTAETQINADLETQQTTNSAMLQTYYNTMMTSNRSEEITASVKAFLQNSAIPDDDKYKFISQFFRWIPTSDGSAACARGHCPQGIYGATAFLDTNLTGTWNTIVEPWLLSHAQKDQPGMCPSTSPYVYDGNGVPNGFCCKNPPTSSSIYGPELNDVCSGGTGPACVQNPTNPTAPCKSYSVTSADTVAVSPSEISQKWATAPQTAALSAPTLWADVPPDIQSEFISGVGEPSSTEWTAATAPPDGNLYGDEKILTTTDANITTQLANMQKYAAIRTSLLKDAPEQAKSGYNLAEAQLDDLTDKHMTSSIMKNEATNIASNVDALRDLGVNKVRSAEINTYYAEQYREQIKIVKLLILIGVSILILTILRKRGILSQSITNILVAIVIVIGCYFAGGKIYNYYRRDNMNFQEFDYSNKVKPGQEGDDDGSIWDDDMKQLKKIDVLDDSWLECRGKECCGPNQTFNNKKGKCIDTNHDGSAETENFAPTAFNA